MADKQMALTKSGVARVLSKVALNVAGESSATHPMDIAAAMANAVEYAAEALCVLRDLGFIDWES